MDIDTYSYMNIPEWTAAGIFYSTHEPTYGGAATSLDFVQSLDLPPITTYHYPGNLNRGPKLILLSHR